MSGNVQLEQPNRRSDGEETHNAILEEAVRLASIEGLSSLTIGRLAERSGISKSGLYAHFGSKQRLQLEVIEAARQIYVREVIERGLAAAPAGLPRLGSLCEAYLSYVERRVFPGGCFFFALIAEYDAQPGQINDEVSADADEWESLLTSLIVEAQSRGEVKETIDPEQLFFELEAALEFTNCRYVLRRDPQILERGRTMIAAALERAIT